MNSDVVITLDRCMCGISAITCFLVMVLYISAKPLRISAFKVIFWLNFNNFCKSLALAIPFTTPFICRAVAYVWYSANLAGLLWTCLIARKVYESIILNQPDSDTHYYCILVNFFVFPYIICVIPFVFNAYGLNTGICLLNETETGESFRLVIYFIPAFIAILYCSFVYTNIQIKLKRDRPGLERDALRLRYFPLILIFCYMPSLTIRILQYFGIFDAYILLFGTFVSRLQGLFDALAYCLTPPVVRYMKIKWNNRSIENLDQSDLFSQVDGKEIYLDTKV